jgi:hypothetical protein
MKLRPSTTFGLQLLLIAVVFGFVFLDDRYIQQGGSGMSGVILMFGIAGSVAIIAKTGEKKSRYLFLLLTIPATIYACMLGFVFIGSGI